MGKQLDNPYSGIVNLMRSQGSYNNSPDVMLGVVVSPPPNILIKVGDIQLDKDNLYIADYMLPNYTRTYEAEGNISLDKSINITGKTSDTYIDTHGNHNHDYSFDINIDIDNSFTSSGSIHFKDTIKAGDLVAIQQLKDTNMFLIYCKVTKL